MNKVWFELNKTMQTQIKKKDTYEAGIYTLIVYRIDVFECDDTPIIDRHIDIDYSFGDCYEIHEDNPLFQFICTLCNLSLAQAEEEEMILYHNEEQ